jgi:PAS domain S-box-containing protein
MTLDPNDLPKLKEKYMRLIKGEDVEPYDLRIIKKDGERRWINVINSLLMKDEKVVGFQIISNDITEKKKAEVRLEVLSSAVEQSNSSIAILDKEGKVEYANPKLYELYRISPDDVIGHHWQSFVSRYSTLREKIDEIRETVLKKGELWSGEVSDKSKLGEEVWRMASIYPIKDDKGEITYIIYSSEDITERKRGEQQTIIQRDLGQSLSAMTNLEEAMAICVETAIHASGMDSGGVYLVDKNTGDLDLFYAKGLSPEFIRAASHYSADSSNAQLVMSGKSTYVLYPELKMSPDANTIPEGLRALAVIPLIHENKVIGCFNIASHIQSEISIPARNSLESIAAQVGSSIARLQAEEALRISEDRYRIISEFISDFVYSIRVEADGTNISEWSTETLERIIGMSHAELLEHGGWKNVIHPEDLPIVVQRQHNLAQGKSKVSEYRVISKDGEVRWVRDYGYPVFDENEGRVVRILGAAQDITERKRAEDTLKTTKERLQYLVSSNPAIIYTSNVRGDFGATFVSENVATLLGYEPREFIEDSEFWANHIHPEDAPQVLAELSHILEHEHHIHEYRFLHKDGTYHWMCDELKLVKDAKGEPVEIIGYWIDITERKKAEEAVLESEAKYRSLFSSSPEAIVLIGLDGTILDCNDVAEKIGGLKKEKLIGKSFIDLDLFEENDISILMDNFQMVLKEEISGPLEFEIKIANENKWIEVFPAFLRKENEVYALQLIIRDITERKMANEALRESEEKFRSLVEEISDVIFSVDQNGTITYMSPAVESLTGYKTSEIVGKSFFDFMHKDDIARAKEGFAQSLSGHAHPNEYQGYHKSGDIFWIRTYSQPIYENGKVMGARGILSDITEQKLAEEELKKSEEKYRDLVENINDIIYKIEKDGTVNYVSPAVEQVLGYSPSELIGKEFKSLIYKDDLKGALENVASIFTGKSASGQYRIIAKSGEIRWIYTSSRPSISEGEVTGLQGILTDITEQKKVEEALIESEEKFRELADLLPQTIYEMNLQGNLTYSNQHGFESTGYSQEDIDYGFNAIQLFIPEDRNAVKENIVKILNGQELSPNEYTVLRKDGSTFPVLIYSRPIIHDGKPKGLRGIVVDITDIKKAEKTLMEYSQKWQKTFDTIKDSICIMDTERRIVQCNKATIDFSKKPLKFILNNDCCKLVHGTEGPIEGCPFSLAKDSHKRENIVFQMNDRWYNTAVDPILDEKGDFTGAVHIIEDITDNIEKQEELKRSLKERELLFRELKHRVKNNLQLLSSMVSMQSMQTENETILRKLQEVQSVIETMALIYSRAYEGPRISGLNLKSFIEELVADLMKFKTKKDMKINYEVKGEDIRLTTDQAIPMALIANELIFNSLKHAFVGRNEGYLSISLKELEESISMAVRDDGVGMAKGIEIDKTRTLGLRIVKNLTEQLQGNLEIINKNGTEFIIEVPKEEVK